MKWRSYPKYKDSGVKWICEIPEHWSVKRIKHTTYVKGRIGWQGLKSDEFIDEGPHLVTGTDFKDGRVNWENTYHVSEERYKEDSYIQLQENDLLITKDGTIGKIAIVKDLVGLACLNSGIFVTRPTTKQYLTDFMYWVLNSDVFSRFIDFTKTGTTISHLYQNIFVEFSYPIPSLSEQDSILAFLNSKTSQIDMLIDKKEQQITFLQEKRAALISHAMTKGLDHKVSMRDSGVEWLGKIPEHWKVKRLKRLARLRAGFGITSETIEEVGEYPVFGGNGIRGFTSSYTHEGELPIIGRQGALCGCVNFAHGKFWASEHAVVATPEPEVNPHWLTYLLRAMSLNTYSQSAAQPGLAVETISALKVCMPDITEQSAISAFLDKETTKIDTLNSKIQNAIEKLKEYRTALISAAVTGKIDVRQEVA